MTLVDVLILEFLLLLVVVIGIACFVSLLSYRLDKRYLRLMFLGISLRKIPVDEIQAIKMGTSGWVEGWANTLSWRTIKDKSVTVFPKSRKRMKIVLTPDHPQQFMEVLLHHPRFLSNEPSKLR